MPEFGPGTAKTAITPITVNPSGLSCQAELFLGPDEITKEATSGPVAFISTGARQDVRLPLTMPSDPDTYHAYIDVYAEGMLIAAYQAIEDVVIALPLPSALLISYQGKLAECIEDCRLGLPSIMLPVYGIQNPCTGIGLMKGLMVDEAISIGMIASAGESYFVDAVMYFTDGTTIVPYWWNCPYCSEKFRSPEQLAQHKEAVHADILATKATITGAGPHQVCVDPPWCNEWAAYSYLVRWKNNSPFAITGRVSIPLCGSVDSLVSPGQEVTVYLPIKKTGHSIPVTLTLVGGALPGLLLDSKSFDYFG